MDITDEQEKLSKPLTTLSQQHTLISPSDHAIPQMVITSADDTSEEPKNVTECTLVLIPPSNGHSTTASDKNTSAEFTESANSVPEAKPVDFEDISVVVRDVVSRCTESVSHSVRQRPLVIEVEKNLQQQEPAKDDISVKCPPPPPPLPISSNVTPPPPSITPPPTSSPVITSPPTTMQRPLVFEGVVTKTEFSLETQKEMAVNNSSKIKDELVCDMPNQGSQLISDIPTESTKSVEECTTPTKKEGLQGVKKFFDSLWHAETQDSAAEEPVILKESDIPSEVSKSEKSSVKKCFSSSQTDSSKSELLQSPESPGGNKEPTFAKDAKQSIKAFFGTFKLESVEPKDSIETKSKVELSITDNEADNERILHSSTPESPKECKQSTSFVKDTKQNIKSFFDTFKHESSEQNLKSDNDKKSGSQPNIDQGEDKNSEFFEPESSKESKGSTSFAKDTKQNIKTFFDSFKHEPNEQKSKSSINKKSMSQPNIGQEENKNLQSFETENPKITTSFAKDTKQNIKSFFDTFKHEPSEQKSKSSAAEISISQPDIVQEMDSEKYLHFSASESPKETKESSSFVKDTKHNIKTFFDTFKHEPSEQRSKSNVTKISISQSDIVQEMDSEKHIQSFAPETPKETKESSSFVKDTKHNLKTFFDTFKHEPSDQKLKDNICKKSLSQPDFSKESKDIEVSLYKSREISKDKESTSFAKDAKHNVKSFFDTFKSESNVSNHEDIQKPVASQSHQKDNQPLDHKDESIKLNEVTKESTSFSKDTRQSIKTFFDNFKHDSGDLKNKEISPKKSTESDLHKEPDSALTQHKESKHPIKKLFSFKHVEDGEISSSESKVDMTTNLPKECGKNKLVKGTKSVKLDLNPQYSSNGADCMEKISGSFSHINGHDRELVSETKERAQSVPSDRERKKFNILSEMRKTEVSSAGSLDCSDAKSEEHKDNLQGIKKFFGSFKHGKSNTEKEVSQSFDSKNITPKDITAMDLAAENVESKTIEKSTKDKKSKSIKRSLSDKVSREEVVQNFKGFFDSISHKSSKKCARDSEHIYDAVEVKPEIDSSIPVIQISAEGTETSNVSKCETQGVKKILNSFRTKDTSSKFGSENIYNDKNKAAMVKDNVNKEFELQKSSDLTKDLSASTSGYVKDIAINDLSSKGIEPGSQKHDKSSMFNAIGENILALKEKMLHSKEKRKSDIVDDSVKPYDISSKIEEKDQKFDVSTVNDQPSKVNICKTKPIPAEKPNKELFKVQTPQSVSKVGMKEGSAAGPGSLYDTCCMRIAVLLRDKALDIVADRTKSPPPKPPKPSAEAIARARAAAVSRQLKEVQRMGHSVGENIPVGCDGIRFADDETESSCDYKDVENFDYIMDYELINRYKLDSSKFDTFSVPSTCSGMTSYYTADTITLRDDIYSDAVMETVSLGSDVSYNFKQLSVSSKSEPKISAPTHREVKNSKVDVTSISKEKSTAKPSTPKKIPPPIPPKPLILQNISRIKGKPEEKAVSQCVNGLSLSPRLQKKFSKDPTQKRPLMVADIKGTQFSSLQHPKPKKVPPKPARNFDTVLKNESLKIVCVTPADTSTIAEKSIPKSLFSELSETKNLSESPLSQTSIKIEKRTKSPPRPPPPNIVKKPEKPPKPERPPPPVKSSKVITVNEMTEEKPGKLESNDVEKELTEEKVFDSSLQLATPENVGESQGLNIPETPLFSNKNMTEENSVSAGLLASSEPIITEIVTDDPCKLDLSNQKDVLNKTVETENDIADSLNNNIDVCKNTSIENPKPPPRNRRIRSRTVEVVPTDRCEERLKRSQSLSEIDVQKRVTFLNSGKSQDDSKSLYTVINKDGKKSNSEKTSQSSPDLVSCRPLPAPPPPPRRFRSLERRGKLEKVCKENENEKNINIEQELKSPVPSSGDQIKPPFRRRRSDKQRFFSLHSDQKKEIDESLKRASSFPSKPDRKLKSSGTERYDVNANISTFYPSQEDINLSSQDIPNIDSTDSLSQNKLVSKRDRDSRSRSSWYDESEILDVSWEIVDENPLYLTDEIKHNPIVPVRRKSESKRKSRETSKFYVNMDEEPSISSAVDKGVSPLPIVDKGSASLLFIEKGSSPLVDKGASSLPLVDKETSPLPLDCSEKSVQTSLETLSQGVVSHDDDQSEDTDELLDLAQTLQKELSTIINRHKSVNESTEETPSPPLSAATSEKDLTDFKELKKISSSVRSSTSEIWPVTSSEESDVERVGEDSSNINEVAVKRKQKKIFYIAREIMTSEEAFVDALKLLNVDFKAAVEATNKQKSICIIPDDVLSQILNHLPQLQHLNENLLMELKDRIENWDKHEKIADIVVKMGPFLKLYSWYIHDFESNVSLLEDCKKKYPAFAQVVKEFEMSARCKRLALNHYMLKPIQRIPQYRLLLQEYLHHLNEDSIDYQDTVAALQIVSEVANHANESMKHGDNAQKLISIQNSIMGHKEIVKPGRVFVKEGELMKLSRKGMQPRWFVLFNDLLLYLTSVQQGLYRVNHELPLTGMKVAIPIQQDYQNEFSIISVTRSFTLAARSQEERQEWIIALTKAIEENASKRSTFTNSRLHQKAQDKTSSEDEGAFVLGKKAPVWIPDARVTMCQLCTSEFTVTFRRHHCRACGKVVCSICSSHRISLPYLGNRIARVCDECHLHLGQGSSACTESGETDSDNQQIAVKPHLRTDIRHIKKNKRMLPSVLKEVCANDQGSTISGYLHKKTGKSWKRDWFVVKDKVLYEYKASEDVAALRSIPLLGYQIESFSEAFEGVDASLLFQLAHPGQAPIIFYADTVGSTERWVSALKTATVLE